jgi:hypothetical protein
MTHSTKISLLGLLNQSTSRDEERGDHSQVRSERTLSLTPRTASDTIQRMLEAEFRRNISDVLYRIVVSDPGMEARHQDSNLMLTFRAGEEVIKRIV